MRRLNEEFDKIKKKEEYKQGILKIEGFPFADISEIEELGRKIESIPFHTLSLIDCSICEQASIRSQFIDNELHRLSIVPSVFISTKLKRSRPTKADAIASLIGKRQWLEINLSANNLAPVESKKIIQAIITTQNKLRILDLGFNSLSERSVDLLATFLQNSQQCVLKYLRIPGTLTLNTKWFRHLKMALIKNQTLRELNLCNNALTDSEVEELTCILPSEIAEENEARTKNLMLTHIDLSYEHLSPEIIKSLKKRLQNNIDRRELLHRELLSHDRLLSQAIQAIKSDDVAWLDIIIGVDQKENEEELLFSQKQFEIFFKVRSLWFPNAIINCQYNFLQDIRKEEIQDSKKLSALIHKLGVLLEEACATEISILKEHLSRVSHDFVEGQFIPLTPIRKKEILQQFKTQIIFPTLKKYRIPLDQETNLETLTQELRLKSEFYERKVEQVKKTHYLLQNSHAEYGLRRKKLIALLRTLDLNKILQQEFEEIADKLIEAHLDPNSIANDNQDSLTYLCFSLKKPNCLKLLLAHDGSILLRNSQGKSIFSELFTNMRLTTCHQIVIKHIQVILDKIWFTLENHPEKVLCKKIKHVLDEYLNILIKNSHMPRLKQFVTGVSKCINERKHEIEQYYGCLHDACKITEANPLNEILRRMLEIAQNARRGWRDQSKLHQGIEKELIPFFQKLDLDKVKEKFEEVEEEFKYELTLYLEREEQLKKEEEELNSYIAMFHMLDVSTSGSMEEENATPFQDHSDKPLLPVPSPWQQIHQAQHDTNPRIKPATLITSISSNQGEVEKATALQSSN